MKIDDEPTPPPIKVLKQDEPNSDDKMASQSSSLPVPTTTSTDNRNWEKDQRPAVCSDDDELAKTVGEKLTISAQEVDHDSVDSRLLAAPSTNTSTTKITTSAELVVPSNTIICDAWYGLPTQKRPRKERVNAVARQLRNFELFATAHANDTSSLCKKKCKVVLVGGASDVKVIGERLEKLWMDEEGSIDGDCCYRVQLSPDTSVESLCASKPIISNDANSDKTAIASSCEDTTNSHHPEQLQQHDDDDVAIYLSPNADHVLDPRKPPPRIVVVGMLIDRRVQPNRSLVRSQKLKTTLAARLPMEELRVEGLENSEALNVDTVLELMVRWWDGVDKLQQQQQDNDDIAQGDLLRRCFLEAATFAMMSHEDRHPNRAIHGSGK